MQLYKLSVMLSCVLALTSGCVRNYAVEGAETKCALGQPCRISGTLGLFKGVPANAAMLTFDKRGGCIALALDNETFERAKPLGDRKVTVSGIAYSPPDMPDLLWYEYRGRKVSRGICDGPLAIYVDSIASSGGHGDQ